MLRSSYHQFQSLCMITSSLILSICAHMLMCHFNADKKELVEAWRLHQYHTLKAEKIKQGAFIDAD